jgi:transcriptional regulator with XRE-family HTH domain
MVRSKPPRPKFGELLRAHRDRLGITLTDFAARCQIDAGNLSKIERGERKPPELPHLVRITGALSIPRDSPGWHELMAAAARDRFETLSIEGYTYLGFANPLHGLPEEPRAQREVTLTEAAVEIGKISESLGVEKITVKASDGSEFSFYIRKGKGRDQSD